MNYKLEIEKLVGHDKESQVGKLHIGVGDKIVVGDEVCTLESGKGTAVVETNASGTVLEVLVAEGDMVKKGSVVVVMDADEASIVTASTPDKKSKGTKKGYSFGLSKPKKETIETDVLIIGGGPGGYVAALHGAKLGKKVTLIEKEALGGTCLNWGCIPTKALAHTAHVLENIQEAHLLGIETKGAQLNMGAAINRKNQVVETLTGGIAYLLENAGIRVIDGEAVAVDAHTVTVNNKKTDATIKAEHIIIATGASPTRLPIDGADLEGVVTSRELLDIETVPERLIVIGGGVIGMEFAFIMNAFGAKVTVIEFQNQLLSVLDQDVIDVIVEEACEKGIEIKTGSAVQEIIESDDKQMIVRYETDDKTHYATGDLVLMATGRKANTTAIDLNVLGVALNERANGIEVSQTLQTSVENIYAIGDVTNKIQLAHVASHQGIVAMDNIAGKTAIMHYDTVPSAIFTTPEIGSVGVTEQEAKAAGIPYKTSIFSFAGNGKALAMDAPKGFVKLIADETTDCIIGGSVVGIHGTDMLPAIVHLMQHNIKVEEAMHTIYAHPTAAEGIHEAILGLKGLMLHG